MGAVKAISIIKSVKVSPCYDMTIRDVREIRDYSEGSTLDAIYNAFKFGYAQGMKAATVTGEIDDREE